MFRRALFHTVLLASAAGLCLTAGVLEARPRRQAAHIYLRGITLNFSKQHPLDATVSSVAHFGHGAIADVILRWLAQYPGGLADPPSPSHDMRPEGGHLHHDSMGDAPSSGGHLLCKTGDGMASACPHEALREIDAEFYQELVTISSREVPRIDPRTPRSEVGQEDVSPLFAGLTHEAIDMIDWTHGLHEVLYDILASPEAFEGDPEIEQVMIPPIVEMDEQPTFRVKRRIPEVMALALDDYYRRFPLAISPAPFEVVIMERVGLNSKPWLRYYRTNFVKAYGYFMLAHWWHPAIYETQIVFPGLEAQRQAVLEADRTLATLVDTQSFPQAMVLSREISPRFTSLTLPLADGGQRYVGAEAGNVFDNLHMLHGIIYDILSAPAEKVPALQPTGQAYAARGLDLEAESARVGRPGRTARREIWRGKADEIRGVIEALKYRPGDEALAASYVNHGPFNEDPRVFVESWMKHNTGRGGVHCGAMMRAMGHCGGVSAHHH